MDRSFNVFHQQQGVIPVRNIYCTVRNYSDHAKEMGENSSRIVPVFFQKSLSSLTTGTEIQLPYDRSIQFECEIVILIKKDGENIPVESAMDYVGGFALGLDLTDRKLQHELKEKQMPWFAAKSFHHSAVVSEFESQETFDLQLPFWLDKNNERVQIGETKDMIHSLPKLIADLSVGIPLLRGDILFTGTPKGVGPIHPGDALTLGLGEKTKGRFTAVNRP